MRALPIRCLAVIVSLGCMAAITTTFQLTLSRPRVDWIAAGVSLHELIMQGKAGDPWQYRILSDYVIDAVFRGETAVSHLSPYLNGLYGFVLVRGAQEVCIFALGFVYFRKLGLSAIGSLIGLAVVCMAMLLGQVQTNWRLDTYTEVALYLLAGIFVLSGRLMPIIPLAALAALNRESGIFIALMPLACLGKGGLRSDDRCVVYRSVGIALLVFVSVRVLLLTTLPSQVTATRVVTDDLAGSLRFEGWQVDAAIALGVIPILGALGICQCARPLRFFFWLIVPAWIVTHSWGNVTMTPTPFLVPLALVFVPGSVCATETFWTEAERVLGTSTVHGHRQTLAALMVVCLLGPCLAALVRLNYPFPLERFEGPMLQAVRRIAVGLPLYAAPTLDYVPLLYAPVYFYVSAGIATLTGVSLLPLRIVSFGAALGSTLLMYLLVSRDAPGRFAGLLAAALFIGTSQLTPTDRYPTRVDALCLLFLLAALTCARRADRDRRQRLQLSAVSGLLVGLAILTKQTAAVAFLPLLVLNGVRCRARLLFFLAGAGAALAVGGLAIFTSSDGWARFYLVDLPRNHGVQWEMLTGFWTQLVLPHFAIPVALAAVFFGVRCRARDYGTVSFYALASAALIGVSWASVLNPGGGENSMPPACAVLAMLFGLGFQAGFDLWRQHTLVARALPFGLLLAAALALAELNYAEVPGAPLRANALAGQQLVAAIAGLPGPVFAPDLGEFEARAGRGEQAFSASWQELEGSYGGTPLPAGRQFLSVLDQALSEGRYAYVLVDPEGFDPTIVGTLSSHNYVSLGPLLHKDDPFFIWRQGFSSGHGYLTPSPDLYVRRGAAQ